MYVDLPIKKPQGTAVQHGMQLSDDFRGTVLGRQWSVIENADKTKFTVADNALNTRCDSKFPSETYPLVLMPQNHFYGIEAEIIAPKGTIYTFIVVNTSSPFFAGEGSGFILFA